MQEYKNFLAELKATGTSRLSAAKPPQVLLGNFVCLFSSLTRTLFTDRFFFFLPFSIDFVVDHVETLTTIHGGKPRRAELQEMVKRIMRKAKPCYSSLVVALFYLDRLWGSMSQKDSAYLAKSYFGRDGLPELIAAFILADKYLYDIALANCEWVKVSGVHTLLQVNAYEREFLALLEYNIQFSEQTFSEFVSFLEVSLSIRQNKMEAVSDFPLTYTDLCVLIKDNAYPSHSTLVYLQLMMLHCASYCTTLLALSANAASIQQSLAAPKQQQPTTTIKHHHHHATLFRSESWSDFGSSLPPKPKDRKLSDTTALTTGPDWVFNHFK